MECKICNKEFDKLGKLQLHITSNHEEVNMEEYYLININSGSNGKCKFCGETAKFQGLTNGFRNSCIGPICVKKSQAPYSKEYKIKVDGLSEDEYASWSIQDKIDKKKNTEEGFKKKRLENPDFDKKNSKYCKEFWINKGYTEIESIKLALNESKKNRDKFQEKLKEDPGYMKGKSWVSKDYWINKGYNKDEAIDIVSEKQKTFSKDICIEKYGEKEGLERWMERQEKWLDTLDKKSDEEKLEILRKKIFLNTVHSKNSQILFKSVIEKMNLEESNFYYATNINGEKRIELEGKYLLKPDLTYKNKIIEFFGDYWHCNPLIRKEDFQIKRGKSIYTAGSIWKIDQWRNELFRSNGYKVLVIWERDYNLNKQETINKCIKFLQDD